MVTAKIAREGQKAMRDIMKDSAAKQIFWPMTAGRYPTKAPGLIDAVNYAGTAAAKFYAKVKAAPGLRVSDANYQLVAVTKAGKIEGNFAFPPGHEESFSLETMKAILTNKLEPIGVAFYLLDREAGELLSHYRPFERTERNERLLSSVLDVWSIAIKRR